MSSAMIEFIRANTALAPVPLIPQMTLHQATEITPLWQATEQWLEATNTPPPYWAFVWAGGQGMARYLLDNPAIVRGKRVLDFAAGSGVAGIAAAMAGAAKVMAADIDPLSQVATQMNAARNGVKVECLRGLDLRSPFTDADLILAGDVCYEQAMSHRVLKWLGLSLFRGAEALLADPGRAYVPDNGLEKLACYEVPVLRELEDRDTRQVTIWKMLPPRA